MIQMVRPYGMVRSVSTVNLTPTSYVVLGMVAMRGTTTSYDLKRAIGHSVGYFWPFPHAQLYSEPKRLVELEPAEGLDREGRAASTDLRASPTAG